ncbi:heat shock protein Hsp20 [Chitinophaga sp. CF118]|uniref:Hsp20/alpha crystallin family protein n=1 Tax=Chitinophaga sp. CF118 TaxID=1884367 RepID=UPI0008DF59B2|nr:Hsp20/alpha crystallin family protein [Chitinophaga sp. CF118]SFD88375.1 heat shock protein Hsp20 [Chitinophaga sp. CF118]
MSNKLLTRKGETIPSIFNDFFKPWDQLWDTNSGGRFLPGNMHLLTVPAVNITDNKNHYEIALAAPGMKKDDFTIDIEGNMLTISSEMEENREERDERFTRREFSYSTFSRSFSLPEGVIKDKIDATYVNGVLRLVLPKTEDAKKQASMHINVK